MDFLTNKNPVNINQAVASGGLTIDPRTSMQFPMIPGATLNAPKPVVTQKAVAPTINSTYKAPQVPTPTTTAPQVPTPKAPAGLGGMTGTIADAYGNLSVEEYLKKREEERNAGLAAEKASLADEMQRQINASNALYANKLKEAKMAGEARIGGTRARERNRGTLGSNVASAAVDNQSMAEQDIYGAIEQERAAAEAAVRSGIASLAKSYYEDKRAAVESDYKERIAFEKNKEAYGDTQAEQAAQFLIANNSNPDMITEKEAKDAGTTLAKVKKAFLLKKYETTQAEAKRKQALEDDLAKELAKPVNLAEGGRLVDPKTGKLIAYNPKTFAPKDGETTSGIVSPRESSIKLNNLINTTKEAIGLSSAAGTSGIMRGLGDTFVGDTDFRQLEALTDSIRTNLLTLNTDPAVKKFFGPQMSNNDVTLMMSAATPLNVQKMTPKQVEDYVTQAQDVFVRAKRAVDQAGGSTVAQPPATQPTTITKLINGVPTVLVKQADGKYYPQK